MGISLLEAKGLYSSSGLGGTDEQQTPFSDAIGAFILCLLPFVWIVYAALFDRLGPDPAEGLQFYIGWAPTALVKELAERPYITLGFSAWLLMFPLAITSTHAMQRRLRGNWQRLHRLVYPAAVLACLHLPWQARSDLGQALIFSSSCWCGG